MTQSLYKSALSTPIGPMIVCATDEGVALLEFDDRKELNTELDRLNAQYPEAPILTENAIIKRLKAELNAYFEGTLREFTTPLVLHGTEFQKSVWNALLTIPYGETRTYMEQTRKIGDEKAIRAVASANGKNQLAIIVPCHRVIGSDGSLTGYAGGLERKRFLLNLERQYAGPKDLFSNL